MVALCLKLAESVSESEPKLAAQFRSAAIALGSSTSEPGGPSEICGGVKASELEAAIKHAWRLLTPDVRLKCFPRPESLDFELGSIIGLVRVLFVHASPTDADAIRVTSELRAIREAIKLSGRADDIVVNDLPAATVDDLRRELLSSEYEIIHIAGHASADSVVLEGPNGAGLAVPIAALRELLAKHSALQIVILNSCESGATLSEPIGPRTIAMESGIDDEAAIEFARGFYDALATGHTVDRSVDAGKQAAALKGLLLPPVKVLGELKATG
jgi:hypothetical protein